MTMEFNKEYTKDVMTENFKNYADDMDISFEYWLENEIENCPESFDVFFHSAWDELSRREKFDRKALILSIIE